MDNMDKRKPVLDMTDTGNKAEVEVTSEDITEVQKPSKVEKVEKVGGEMKNVESEIEKTEDEMEKADSKIEKTGSEIEKNEGKIEKNGGKKETNEAKIEKAELKKEKAGRKETKTETKKEKTESRASRIFRRLSSSKSKVSPTKNAAKSDDTTGENTTTNAEKTTDKETENDGVAQAEKAPEALEKDEKEKKEDAKEKKEDLKQKGDVKDKREDVKERREDTKEKRDVKEKREDTKEKRDVKEKREDAKEKSQSKDKRDENDNPQRTKSFRNKFRFPRSQKSVTENSRIAEMKERFHLFGPDECIRRCWQKIRLYDFEFENLAFEGGGAKMVGYVGTVQALEELGVLARIKRMSGTSGGAIVAMLLAIGMDSAQMKECLSENIRVKLMDSSFGKFAFLPNMMSKFGWNPATKFTEFVRDLLKKQTGQDSMTFKEVYDRYGTELCIVATNITTMSVEYFHPKTTPDFDIVTAVRCSVSLPGYLQPVRVENDAGMIQYYLDGGLVCNFPLHTFDGWYLSMKFEDSFFNKLGGEERPFGTFNPKTLGIMLMSSGEGDFMQDKLHLRQAHVSIDRPNTVLAKKRGKKCDENLVAALEKAKLCEAGHQFLNALREVDDDKNTLISMDEFKAAFEKFQPNQEQVEMLFGKDFTWDKAFAELDKLQNGTICIDEFLWFMQKKGIRFRALLEGGNMMTSIETFGDFFEVTFNTILNTTRKAYYKSKDINRTVSIYVDYIDTTDFDLEEGDKTFLVKQGVIGALTYLEELVERKKAQTLSSDFDAIVIERSVPHDIVDIGGVCLVEKPAEGEAGAGSGAGDGGGDGAKAGAGAGSDNDN